MSTIAIWSPIRFPPDVEQAYRQHLLPRLVPLLRLGSAFGMFAFAGFQFWDLQLDPGALGKTGPIRLAVVAFFLLTLGTTFVRPIRDDPRRLFVVTVCIYSVVAVGFALILAQLPNGFVAGVSGFILGMIFIPVIVFSVGQAVAALIPLVVLPMVVIVLVGGTQFDLVNAAAWLIGGASFAAGFAYILDIINRRAFQLERLLDQEKQRTEELLLNILPAEIAKRLKDQEEPIADHCESVSVLFADLVGFTNLSRNMPATELVSLLNDLFSRFDALVERHGVEKIKTIGDAYMVAAGLTGGAVDHVATIAALALDMRRAFGEFREQHKLDLRLRIGVHTGAVVAGVIGRRKFTYDLWGDTVNVASRMESEGLPDEIQISEETQQQLASQYHTTPRGEIDIKGHRPRMTYLLRASA
jgi:class 3 adenylate cyclase